MAARCWQWLLAAMLLVPAVAGAGQRIAGTAARVSMLELYTSEGCSSCPPADRWLARFLDDPRLWRQVVPVAFHVDYWDYLGWRDPFAEPAYAERQRNHARAGNLNSVYTPGLLLNGREWRAFFGHRNLLLPTDRPGTLLLDREGSELQARFVPDQHRLSAGQDYRISVALLGFGIVSHVVRGENAGRRFVRNFSVLGFRQRVLQRDKDRGFSAVLSLPGSAHAAKRYAVAAWLSVGQDMRVLQAVGDFLQQPAPRLLQ